MTAIVAVGPRQTGKPTIVHGEPVSYYTFYKEIRLGQFTNFGSLQLIDINVPPLTVSLICYIRGTRTPLACPVRNINVYWQYGSIPVAEYQGKATFPKGFALHRSYLNSTVLLSDDLPVTLQLENPIPGTWFLAAFVEKNDDEVIKKITNVDCSYGIQMNVTTSLTSSVSEIEAGKSLSLRLNSPEHLFRFFVAGNVYKYSVSLSCNELRCPLFLSARASGLPTHGNDTVDVNCSEVDSSKCLLNFLSPAVDQWHYLRITCLRNRSEDVTLSINAFACGQETPAEPTKRTTPMTRTATTFGSLTAGESPTSSSTFTPDRDTSSSTLLPSPSASSSTPTLSPITADSTITSNPSNSTLTPSSVTIEDNFITLIGASTITQSVFDSPLASGSIATVPHSNLTNSTLTVSSMPSSPTSHEPLIAAGDTFSKANHKVSSLPTPSFNPTTDADKNPPAAGRHLLFVADDDPPILSKTGVPSNRLRRSLTSDPSCFSPARFAQVVDVDNTLSTIFSAQPMSSETLVIVTREVPYLMRFDIHPIRDIGSTLKIQAVLHDVLKVSGRNDSQENVSMKVCIQRNSIPLNDALALSCMNSEDFFLVTPGNASLLRWYPFPEPGPWFIGIQKVCYRNMSVHVPCQDIGAMSFKVMTTPCVDDSCNNMGNCVEYGKSVYSYAVCQCIAGYRGYACDDDTKAASNSLQMAFSFFLSMSNLLFIPAVGVACWRRRFAEALVYFANMFFSSFYHACDMSTWSHYKLCIMPYHVLSFCDFYCSMLSFWVTLTAMARLPIMLRSVAHMAGAVALAMAMKWNMHGVITNVVPIAVGAGMVIVSWAVRCGRLKRLFPQKKSLLWTIPGVALAAFGICLFGFVETDANYPYTHSIWHICMSLSIIFLLPRSKVQMKDDATADSSSFQLDDFNDTSVLIVSDFNRTL